VDIDISELWWFCQCQDLGRSQTKRSDNELEPIDDPDKLLYGATRLETGVCDDNERVGKCDCTMMSGALVPVQCHGKWSDHDLAVELCIDSSRQLWLHLDHASTETLQNSGGEESGQQGQKPQVLPKVHRPFHGGQEIPTGSIGIEMQ
jgi:hypothetical protein